MTSFIASGPDILTYNVSGINRKTSKPALLGCNVGTCCAILSSFSMCNNVVLPALSRPRNTNFPDFLYKPTRYKNKIFMHKVKQAYS